jgi:hypothetical protein
VADVLAATGAHAESAARELSALSRGAGDRAQLDEAVRSAKKSAQDATLEATQMLVSGIDREDVVRIALSLRLIAERIEEAAIGLEVAPHDAVAWEPLAGVTRDLVREVAAIVAQFDSSPAATDARFAEVEGLHRESRRLLRASWSQLLTGQDNPAVAVSGQDALRRFERAMLAARRSSRTVQRVVVKHR